MAVSDRDRQRARRARLRAGRGLQTLEHSDSNLLAKLLKDRLLKPTQVDIPEAIHAAAQALWDKTLEQAL